MGRRGGVRPRPGLALLTLTLVLVPIDAALGQQPPTTAPPITIPGKDEIRGGAENTNDSVGATLTGLGGQGSGGGSNTGGSGSGSGTGTRPSTGSGGGSSGGGSSGGSRGGGSGGGGSTEPPITNPVSCSTFEEYMNPAPGTHCGTNAPFLPPAGPPATPAGPTPSGGAPRPTVPPRSAAQIARDTAQRTAIPLPAVRTSPPAGNDQLVNLPTWLWVEDWTPRRASVTEGPLTVTVVATPRSVTWRMGDGSSVVCGRGTPWDPALREEQQSTDCSHTYTRSSATQPDLKYQARAIMSWDVTWTATNGESGSLGQANRSVDFTMRVAESQAIVTWSGR